MKKQPLISVLLPVYNDRNFIKQTIDSVLRQTYSHFELIIVDDGSTDGTDACIRQYQDERVKPIFLKENRHICNALNVGLEHATGEYIARIDSGDFFENNKLEKQILYLEEHPECGACFTWANIIDEFGNNANDTSPEIFNLMSTVENRTQAQWIDFFIRAGNCLCHPSVCMRKSILDKVGWYDIAYVQGQDYDLWLRMVAKAPIYVMQEYLVKYSWELNKKGKISAQTQENDTRFYNERVSVIEHFFDTLSNEDFCTFFRDKFIRKDAHTAEELACEKAFYLLHCMQENVSRASCLGVKRLYSLLQDLKTRKVLEEKYQFTLHDFYRLNTEHLYYDYLLYRKMDTLIAKLSEKENDISYLKESISSLKESISASNQFIQQEGKDIGSLQDAIRHKNAQIQQLKESKGVRMMRPLQQLKDRLRGRQGYQPVIYFLATYDYGNLGDHLIVSCMYAFLQHYFPDTKIVEVSVRSYDAKKSQMVSKINNEDVLVIPGGGAISYKYLPFIEKYFHDIIHCFPNNQIIAFPQSLYFDDTEQEQQALQNSGAQFSSHSKLTLCLREENSVQKAQGIYHCHTMLIPDIALFGSTLKIVQKRQDVGLYIIREDCETALEEKEKQQIIQEVARHAKSVEKTDTQLDYFVEIENRDEEVKKLMTQVASAKFLVTDRLHGMIFAALTQTPCVALDNCYHKVSGTYEWIKNLPYIKLARDAAQVGELLDQVLQVPNPTFNNANLMPYFDRVAKVFHIK